MSNFMDAAALGQQIGQRVAAETFPVPSAVKLVSQVIVGVGLAEETRRAVPSSEAARRAADLLAFDRWRADPGAYDEQGNLRG